MHLVVRRWTSGNEWMISIGFCSGDLSLSLSLSDFYGAISLIFFPLCLTIMKQKRNGVEKKRKTFGVCLCGGVVFNDNMYVKFY